VRAIHDILAESIIGPGSRDGEVSVKWKSKSETDTAAKNTALAIYPSLAVELAMRAWKLRDLDAALAWERSGGNVASLSPERTPNRGEKIHKEVLAIRDRLTKASKGTDTAALTSPIPQRKGRPIVE
jgi:hypothetical protein